MSSASSRASRCARCGRASWPGLRHSLQALPALRAAAPAGSTLLAELHAALQPDAGDRERCSPLPIADEPAVLLRDGGVIAPGHDAELDELRAITHNCDAFLLELEARERSRTAIPNLRVQFNKVHGFYIEVTASHVDKVPADYQRRQTLKNAERYITPELKAFEDKALAAEALALAREKWLYEQLLDALQPHLAALAALARALAALDALAALAERAATLGWCRPQFVAHPCIDIEAGRHPVVQARLAETGGGEFIANHCRLDAKTRLLVITGPNMGGKSTYMRQVALIVLLAAMGSYVPAAACRLGPIDAIHTRIGAADDLANAQSTFMVEMTEGGRDPARRDRAVAGADGRDRARHLDLRRPGAGRRDRQPPARQEPLVHAVRDALLRVDRIPREACRRRQHARLGDRERRPRHRVPARGATRPGQPQLRRAGGAAGRHAGRPWCGRRALRSKHWKRNQRATELQVDLFAAPPPPLAATPSAVDDALADLDPDSLTPREALDALYRLKQLSQRTP